MAKVHDNATDLITFARSSSGTALRRVGYGDELVTNGTFDADTTGWSAVGDTSWAWDASGAAAFSGTSDTWLGSEASIPIVSGQVYRVDFEIKQAGTGSGVRVYLGGATHTQASRKTAVGVYTTYITADTGTSAVINIASTGGTWIVDNISVKEVIFDRATDPLVLFNHPDDIPRIEYGSDGSLKGLLIEEQRTNLFPSSNDFETWAEQTPSGPTTGFRHIQENAAIGPDGQTSAHKLVESTDFDLQRIYRAFSGMTANTDYTYSVFLKAGERTEAYVRTTETSGMLVDLSDGTFTVSGGSNHAVQPVGNNWYRCSLTVNETGTTVVPWVSIRSGGSASYTGDGTSGIYVYGAQFEAGSFPTSYIPTSGSTATRSADVASIPVSAFGYNQEAGTVVVDFATLATFGSRTNDGVFTLGPDTGSADVLRTYIQANDDLTVQMKSGGSNIFASNVLNDLPEDARTKIAVAIESGSQASSVNGAAVTSLGTSASLPVAGEITEMAIGEINGNAFLNGHVKSIQYYPRRLTDAQLQELTA